MNDAFAWFSAPFSGNVTNGRMLAALLLSAWINFAIGYFWRRPRR